MHSEPEVCPNCIMAGEVKPAEDFRHTENSTLLQLEELRVSNSKDVGEIVSNSSSNTSEQLNRGSVEDKSQERDGVDLLESSYNLLCEDDPDDFISVEIPVDSANTDSDAPPLELAQMKKKGKFLDSLRRNHSSGEMRKTVITGRRRGSRGIAAAVDQGGVVKGEEKLGPHDWSDDWPVTDVSDEKMTEDNRRSRSSEPWRVGSHSSNEDEVMFPGRPRANDFTDVSGDLRSPKFHSHREQHGNAERVRTGSDGHAHTATTHDASHQHLQLVSPSQLGKIAGEEEEELHGMTAGIGLTSSPSKLQCDSSPVFDPSLRSDMLMSLNTGEDPEMSVQQSLHIGVAPGDLQVTKIRLLSDEEMAKEASRARIDSVGSDHREYEDEDVESSAWCDHQKHVFVLSLSGKPVYSRYGKEDKLVNLFGIMQALVSFVQDDRDNLRSIISGKHRLVFVCRGPLVLVSVAQSRQSETQLAIQLNYVYNQILSVLTHTQLSQIFEKSPSYDLRYMLQGSEKFVDNILNMIDTDPSFIIGGIRCLSMSVPLRHIITSTLIQCRSKDVLFAVVVANSQVVTYIKPREHNLVPIDIHIILNLVDASTSFRSAESWTPICLPKFNDTGFLHAHVSYLQNESPACMLLFSTNKEMFFDLHECQQRIVEKLEKQGCISLITEAVRESDYNIDHLRSPEIRHFLYKSRKTSGVTSPKLPSIYDLKEDRQRLFALYMFMHERLHSSSWPTKILYHVGNKEALLGWRTANFDLYIIFDPLISKSQAISSGNKLIKWIIRDEDKLIITSSHTF